MQVHVSYMNYTKRSKFHEDILCMHGTQFAPSGSREHIV